MYNKKITGERERSNKYPFQEPSTSHLITFVIKCEIYYTQMFRFLQVLNLYLLGKSFNLDFCKKPKSWQGTTQGRIQGVGGGGGG